MKPSTVRVLSMLKHAGARGVTSGEFAQAYVLRYSARLHELRKAGYQIRIEWIPDRSSCRYVLKEPI